jgi:LPXTG-site transpeptidase (sortase) family protein
MNVKNKISVVAATLLIGVSMAVSTHAQGLSLVTPSTGFIFARDLTLGVRGDDVSALQKFLIDNGFLNISKPTGLFGPLTKQSLSVWQASVGISPSVGFFGRISREKINMVIVKAPIDTVTSTTTSTTATSTMYGCSSNVGFSPTTGQPCGVVSTISSTTSMTIVETKNGLPVRLKIPKINVDTGFQYNGLKPDGTMEIPNNVVDIGWFTGSVRPGENGTSVVTGHVAQIRGGVLTKPGVFINLKNLGVGDTLTILNDKGEPFTFVVRETRNYDPSADATDVFSAKDNGTHLNIITCEGTWHPDQLSYSQRLVVFTDLVR